MQIFVSIIYGLALAFLVSYGILAVYHAAKFRYLSQRSKKLTFIFLVVSLLTMSTSLVLFYTVNWDKLS